VKFEQSIKDKTYQLLALKLCQLPCFNQLEVGNISVIAAGLSQPCFHIQYQHKNYFAKYLAVNRIEPLASELAANEGISPQLIYVGDNWLITEFIVGKGLDKSVQSEADKLTILLKLLAHCHHIAHHNVDHHQYLSSSIKSTAKPWSLPKLDISSTIQQLRLQIQIPPSQELALNELSALLLKKLAQAESVAINTTQVFCHGDANFSNVIQANNDINKQTCRYQLVDFECACLAPIEYDLAMLMAVNNIDLSKLVWIKSEYESQLMHMFSCKKATEIVDNLSGYDRTSNNFSLFMVTCYYDLSLLINGLWYSSQFQSRKLLNYKILAIQQFNLLKSRYPQIDFALNEMR
jgi:thiamine kinase-like enzyme